MKLRHACTLLLASTSFVWAAPVQNSQIDDGVILNYALTLEFLEAQFYKEALANFSDVDFDAAGLVGIRDVIVEIGADEQTHADFLVGALAAAKIPAVKPCKYSFPVTDIASFLGLAQIIEGVGVSAYLGAAALISDKNILTAAGSILPVEARHNTFLIGANKGDPIPAAFDTPLGLNEVFTIASPFIVSCPPDNPTLPLKAFKPLVISDADITGLQVHLSGTIPDGTFAVVISGLKTFPIPVVNNQFTFPSGTDIKGQVYIVLSKDGRVSDDSIIAGPAILNVS